MNVAQGASAKLGGVAFSVGENLKMQAEQDGRTVVKCRLWFHRLLSNPRFDASMGVVILINAVVVGLQIDTDAKRRYQAMPKYRYVDFMEWWFVFVYTSEVLLRYFVYGIAAFRSGWVRFDALLVTTSWTELVLRAVKDIRDGESGRGVVQGVADNDAPGIWGILRLLRIAKLVRPFRLIGQFRALWLLMQGLYKASGPVFSSPTSRPARSYRSRAGIAGAHLGSETVSGCIAHRGPTRSL